MPNSADPDQLASLDLHCLQRQGVSGFSRTSFKYINCFASEHSKEVFLLQVRFVRSFPLVCLFYVVLFYLVAFCNETLAFSVIVAISGIYLNFTPRTHMATVFRTHSQNKTKEKMGNALVCQFLG